MDKTNNDNSFKRSLVKISKSILWSALLLFLIHSLHSLTIAFLHPVGGGELHHIFAYFRGDLEVAEKVYLEYIIAGWLISSLFIFFRYPLHWYAIAILTSLIVYVIWSQVCFFPYQGRGFFRPCFIRLMLSPLFILTSVIARYPSNLFFSRLKGKDQAKF